MDLLTFEQFPLKTTDKIRYADTDRQGHVNNAVFSVFLETGRVELLYNSSLALAVPGASFVIANLQLSFMKELVWPGHVAIGTGIRRIGTSSITIYQQLFQQEQCCAKAETIIVQVAGSGTSLPLSDQARLQLSQWMLPV